MSYARSAVTRMTLDMSRPDLQRSETVTQGDTNRRWEVTLINGGAPFRLPPNWTAALTGIKPDGNGLQNGCSVVDGKIIYDFAAGKEIATCVGGYPVQLDIWDEVGELVASPKVYINVLADVRPREGMKSESEYGLLGEFIAQKDDLTEDIKNNTTQIGNNTTQIGNLSERMTQAEDDIDILTNTSLNQGDDITALKEKVTTAGTVTIHTTQWSYTTPHTAYMGFPSNTVQKGQAVLFMPLSDATKEAAAKARLSVGVDEVTDGGGDFTDYVLFVQAEEGAVPTVDLDLGYIVLRTAGDLDAMVALIGVDAYGGGGTASGVDESAVRAIITAMLGNVDNERQYSAKNPPPYPVTSVNGKKGTVNLNAEDVGARPSTWMPTAANVGADPANTAQTLVNDLARKTAQDLANYYTKDQTLTKDEINALVSAIPKFKIEVVTSLPSSNISETTVYLVKSWADSSNLYTEYIRANGAWERLGTQTVDLTGYATEAWVNTLIAAYVKTADMEAYVAGMLKAYQPAGDYLTPTDAAPIINTEVNKVVTERKEELRGEPGETPEAGVDYPTFEQVDSYIAAELAKRNQFVPIPAASVEGMTDTTKIYYLTATGELYAYAPAQVVVGGYTNLADPAAEGWQNPARINESGAITTGSATGSFVTPIYPAKAGQKIYIKGVKEIDTSMRRFRVVTYDESDSVLYPAAYKLIGSANLSEVGPVVTVSDDGVYCWTIGQLKTGDMHETASRIAGVRVTGGAIDGDDNVVITIDEPIVEPTIETVYQWSGTGHFISSEEAVTSLESRVNKLEDEVEELTVTIDRLKTNSSISMQSGAVWYALGDSITQGYASRVNTSATLGYDQYVAAEGKRWVDHVASLNGYKLTNYGVGGTGYQHSDKNARSQVDGIDFSECDLVTLAYGINDFKNAGTNIGSMEDDIQAGGSFVSNMRYCIKKILADNPLCKIIVITPLNYRGLGTYATNYSIGYTGANASCENLDYMVDLMEQVCKYHGIEMIDMTHSSIVNRENIVAMLPDYVHPSEECHRILGYELARKINFA